MSSPDVCLDDTPAPAGPASPGRWFWTLERRMLALLLAFATTFGAYVAIRSRLLNETRINGAAYLQLRRQADLIRDLARPRLSVLEPYFLAHEAVESAGDGDHAAAAAVQRRLAALVAEHLAARADWSAHARAMEVEAQLAATSRTADALLTLVNREVLPRLAAGDIGEARRRLNQEGRRLYQAHEEAVHRFEAHTTAALARHERAARDQISWLMQILKLAGTILVAGFCAVAVYGTRRIVLRPARRAVQHFEEIGAGDYSRPVRTRRRDEFGDMLRALERMRVNLREAVETRDRSLARLRVLSRAIESSRAGVVITDTSGLIEYVNPAFTQNTGYPPEEALGRSPRLLKSGHHPPAFYRHLWETISSGQVWHGDFVNRRKDGTLIREEASISPVPDESGRITHFVAVKTDVTQQREMEEALRVSEERFALAIEGVEDGLWDWNLETGALYHSPRWKSMLGYAADEIAPTIDAFDALVHPEDLPAVRQTVGRCLAQGTSTFSAHFRMRHKEGRWVDILGRGVISRNADGKPVRVVGTHVDLTERAAMERRLQHAEQRFRDIVEQSVQGFYQSGMDGRIQFANASLARILGYDSPQQVVDEGPAIQERLHIDPARRREYVRRMRADGYVLAFECQLRRRDGQTIWVAENARAVFAPDGTFLHFEGFLEDISARKEAEQLKADFVSFATHQLRTPLAGIRWMLELARELVQDEETGSYLADAHASAERLIGLVNDLLDVARLESGRLTTTPVPADLRHIAADVLADLGPLATARRQQVRVADDDVPLVLVDPQLARQAMLNLLSNAIKYTPEEGAITVTASAHGGMVHWSVRDTGIGVPAASHRRLFEKFYRADNANAVDTEGTGLGLYLVRLIAERSGGSVSCTSAEGEGSTFTLHLPVAAIEEAPAACPSPSCSLKTTVS